MSKVHRRLSKLTLTFEPHVAGTFFAAEGHRKFCVRNEKILFARGRTCPRLLNSNGQQSEHARRRFTRAADSLLQCYPFTHRPTFDSHTVRRTKNDRGRSVHHCLYRSPVNRVSSHLGDFAHRELVCDDQ